MSEMILINYDSDRPTVLGRDLHEALGIKSSTQTGSRICVLMDLRRARTM